MKLPQIRLESQPAMIQMNSKIATQSIEQPAAGLDIQQPPAELHIERTPAKFTVDQSQAWADMDLKPISKRIKEFAQNGYQDWLDGIARRAEEGDQLMRVENGGNPIASISKENSKLPTHEFNFGLVPSPLSVKTYFDPSKLDIQWDTKKPSINVRVNKPTIEYSPGNVSISMKQYQSLKIDFTNINSIGSNFENQI
ncbi:hypothetical protein AN964_05310 [Heyndrickxia shackletonii]|uniref:Uncharacterized protein n=1 Tax=Heyndrickxia shackletonii TaxID=157838 RepID=A0A0Q3TH53_9BACI|nr:DUF6470 family protein [Heyndrickxia shackletonii]KQL52985.1 hypothetical protein AN964_05310 [Heyndrickxia shackletonii]NEY98533.1 hypothetical protein [Heyndrickxia shackletonii]